MIPHHVKCSKTTCPNRIVPPRDFIKTPYCRVFCPQHREKQEKQVLEEERRMNEEERNLEFFGYTRQDFENRISSLASSVKKETLLTHRMVEFNINCIEACPKCDSVETFANACERCGHCLECSSFIVCKPTPQLTLSQYNRPGLKTGKQVKQEKKTSFSFMK
jgi:hypothetical protein